jgi:hypothetical protein
MLIDNTNCKPKIKGGYPLITHKRSSDRNSLRYSSKHAKWSPISLLPDQYFVSSAVWYTIYLSTAIHERVNGHVVGKEYK